MKNIELSACEEMIMTIIWNNEAELDLAAVMTQTNERYHTAWKPQTVSTFLASHVGSDGQSPVLLQKQVITLSSPAPKVKQNFYI